MNIFENKVAVITGGASGIGLGIAKGISELGGIPVLLDIDEPRLKNAQAEFPEGKSGIFAADVTDFGEVSRVFASVVSKFGKIDFLFNNAGIGGLLPITEASMDQWKKIVDLNLMGVVHGTMAVIPVMKAQGSGHIVNTSSISGLIPFPGQTLYNTTKFAVTGLSLSLVPELKKHNISISIICPGMVHTRIFYKPIIGAEAPEEAVKIPPEAIPVETAVKDILNGLRKKKKIIITPRFLKLIYLKYRLFGRI